MMTRKDYVAVSEILADYQEAMEADEYYAMVMDFGKMMKLDNARFDLSRFMIACGIDTKAVLEKAIRAEAFSTLPQPKPASSHVSLQ